MSREKQRVETKFKRGDEVTHMGDPLVVLATVFKDDVEWVVLDDPSWLAPLILKAVVVQPKPVKPLEIGDYAKEQGWEISGEIIAFYLDGKDRQCAVLREPGGFISTAQVDNLERIGK